MKRHTTLLARAALLGAALWAAAVPAAHAHRSGAASEASALSLLPVAVSAAVPAALLSVGAVYTVKAVEVSAAGTVWVLERASDGVSAATRFSLTLAGAAAAGASVVVGTAVVATACSAGWVLHSAGRAIAIVPNAVGQTLMYNEQVTR